MVTITLTLDDETYERIRARASELGMGVEDYLAAAAEAEMAPEVSPEFRDLMQRHMAKYQRLFTRLAE